MISKPALVICGLALQNPHVGQGVYTLRLIEGLARRIPGKFVVIAPDSVRRPIEISEDHFLAIPASRTLRNALINYPFAANRLLKFAADEFPQSVFHSPGPILGLARPARTVVTLHDCIYRHFSNYNGRFFLRRLLMQGTERFAARASLVLTDSEFSRRDLIAQAKIPPDKIEVLYPWVGNDFLQPIDADQVSALRRKFNLPEKFWLYLGGYDYRKNVAFLVEAYATALRSRPLPPLVLAGAIPVRLHRAACDVLGALRKTGLQSDQVLMPGVVSNNELPVLYKAASLLIYPSRMEGFGLPPAEAMAVGTPVLAANNSSLPEVVHRTDCLFDAARHEELKEKMLAAAEGEARFSSELPATFTEAVGVDRYLRLIDSQQAER